MQCPRPNPVAKWRRQPLDLAVERHEQPCCTRGDLGTPDRKLVKVVAAGGHAEEGTDSEPEKAPSGRGSCHADVEEATVERLATANRKIVSVVADEETRRPVSRDLVLG